MPRAIEHAKKDILEAARRLMDQRGYASLAMREVAAECGLATGTLYNYYPAKDALVYELMLQDWTSMLAELDVHLAAEGRSDPHASLRRLFGALRAYFRMYRDVWTQMAATPRETRSDVVLAYDPGVFVRQLTERIGGILPETTAGGPGRDALLDVVVRLFSTYAPLEGYAYDFLDPVVRKLLA